MTPKGSDAERGTDRAVVDIRRAFPADARIDRWRAADGWALRRYRQAGRSPRRGALLFLTGRGDFLEKYTETFNAMAERGWDVTAIDWRGQGGSGRLCTTDPLVGHCDSFDPWLDDLDDFCREWTANTAGPHVVVGHSMGGHLLLRAMAERRVRPDAAVLVAPMLGLNSAPVPEWLARRIVRWLARTGHATKAAWRDATGSPGRLEARRRRLTHSIDRHEDELWWRRHDPDLALSGPSWRWLDEAYRSIDALAGSPGLKDIDLPVLVLATRGDRLVSAAAIDRIVRRMPDATVHFYGMDAAHEILREADAVRDDALDRIERFLNARVAAEGVTAR